jgi:peptide deformylase
MILPIIAYGDPVLKKKGLEIDAQFPDLKTLVDNMWQTMYKAEGVGLAAPQIGQSIRLFIVDTIQMQERKKTNDFIGIKKVFINATILSETGEEWKYQEGCLSIPWVREDVHRKSDITIRYQDLNFEWHEEKYDALNARVIQHEYDHIEGILFIDKLKPLKKKLLQGKLQKIMRGDVDVDYRMKFPFRK